MDCKTAQKWSDRYLYGELPTDILPEYLAHIRTCEHCMENLRTDYSLTRAIDQINRNEDFSTDYTRELEGKLERSRQTILRHIRTQVFKRAVVFGLIAVIAVFLATRLPAQEKYFLPEGREESLQLRFYGIDESADPVKETIRRYNDEAIRRLRDNTRNEDGK